MNAPSEGSWFQQEHVYPAVRRISEPHVHKFFRANMFVIEGRDSNLVIDFGMGLVPFRPALNLVEEKPIIALATHVHVDHIGGFHEFKDRLGHRLEADAFASMPDETTLIAMFRDLPEPVEHLPAKSWKLEGYSISPAALTRVVDEGDKIELGDFSFEVMHLPGHSPGSIGLLERDRRILFSGDSIYAGTLVDDIPGADKREYLRTMARLANLNVDIVCGGHNQPISGDEMREIANRYLATKSLPN